MKFKLSWKFEVPDAEVLQIVKNYLGLNNVNIDETPVSLIEEALYNSDALESVIDSIYIDPFNLTLHEENYTL